jgi:probable phosphoglycerate mutase
MTARLFIVRHGNTFEKGDVVTRVGGRTDLPLTATGEEQAKALGRHFRAQGIDFATARSGPLRRTRRTAELILAGQIGPPELQTEVFLREIDYGPDENRPEAEVVARIGKAALEAWEDKSIPPPDWRVDPAAIIGNWQELFSDLKTEEGVHLIVTSNGIARFALAAVGAEGPGRAPPKLATGAYGAIDLDPGGAATVMSWNLRPPVAG